MGRGAGDRAEDFLATPKGLETSLSAFNTNGINLVFLKKQVCIWTLVMSGKPGLYLVQ